MAAADVAVASTPDRGCDGSWPIGPEHMVDVDMAKTSLEGAGRFSYQYPRLVVVVTSHAGGKSGAMTAAWHSPISVRPPLYGISISPGRNTHALIVEGKEFGVNFLPYEKAKLMAAVGGSTGREVDKFEAFGIDREEPLKTSVPLLKDAYAAYECKLVDHRPYGDHDWMIGEVVATHILDEAYDAHGVLDVARFNPALYLGSDFYVTTSKESLEHLDRRAHGRR